MLDSTFGEEVPSPLLIRFLMEIDVIWGFSLFTLSTDAGDFECTGEVVEPCLASSFLFFANSAAFFFQ